MTINSIARAARLRASQRIHLGVPALVIGALCLLAPMQAAASANPIPNLADWSQRIANVEAPGEGCFTAAYPSMQWVRMACGPTPKIVPPAHGLPPATVGNGTDYVASVSGLISSTKGTFPVTKRLKTEYDSGDNLSDTYSLQLNSNYFSGSPACAGAAVPANCQAWQQFTFNNEGSGSNQFGAVTMQYWLLRYAPAKCPKGWNSFYPHCVTNSPTVYLGFPQPTIPAEYIGDLTLIATAKAGGHDKVVLITKAQAYTVSAKDSVVDLAAFWNQSEFNVFGISLGSDAMYNTRAFVRPKVQVKDSAGAAPACVGGVGTTAEGNNMTLGPCSTVGNSIQFTESN
jgi:hypothetical protein